MAKSKNDDKKDEVLETYDSETPKTEEKVESKKPSELEIANEKIEDLTDTLKRLQAEFENYRKRVEKENKHRAEYASANLIEKLLPIIDTFEIALKDSCTPEKFREGAKLIYVELMTTLKNEGVRKIDALNKNFDPNYHDAMIAVDADCEKDKVVEVLQEGYMLKDKVLRHSKVKISKYHNRKKCRQKGYFARLS